MFRAALCCCLQHAFPPSEQHFPTLCLHTPGECSDLFFLSGSVDDVMRLLLQFCLPSDLDLLIQFSVIPRHAFHLLPWQHAFFLDALPSSSDNSVTFSGIGSSPLSSDRTALCCYTDSILLCAWTGTVFNACLEAVVVGICLFCSFCSLPAPEGEPFSVSPGRQTMEW